MDKLSDSVYRFVDSCNVYVVRSGREAVLIDFGCGDVLDKLPEIGVEKVSAILVTHHHRDQVQGLPRAVEQGIPIWVPSAEQDLFAKVDEHWQSRPVANNYNNREDRFSLLEPVPVSGLLGDYSSWEFSGVRFTVLPTPGHTTGSLTLLADVDGKRWAFSGDLIAAPGQVWSLAATQWTYNGAEGVAASIASLISLKGQCADVLLPSHGEPMDQPALAIDLLIDRLWKLLQDRGENSRLFRFLDQPYDVVTPHLLWNRTSVANAYVLLSESGKALMIDFGYDFVTGFAAGTDRASRRPWLYTIPKLKSDFGVKEISAVILTHYHDDHVAGCNLLREVEGTKVWAAENFATILQFPEYYDLPCLWYDPIPVDRVLPLEQPIQWEEYTLTCYPLPGHTRYAVGISFEVDGQRVLAVGDQYQNTNGQSWNYVYANRFNISDYRASAALYRKLSPDVILSGHWGPYWVEPDYFDRLDARGEALEAHHRALLPLDAFDLGGEDQAATIHPYRITARAGQYCDIKVVVRNPFNRTVDATIRLVTPSGWGAQQPEQRITLDAHGTAETAFALKLPSTAPVRRARIAADITLGGKRLGQVAEALVNVLAPYGQPDNASTEQPAGPLKQGFST
jgi:glyoxylase-like metal-dependent hydrolase (beta-lactamase superfamily II)